jgi:hypothetical protein
MSFVGLDPDRAGALAAHLDEAAADLNAHAQTVERLLADAGIVSSQAPAQIRDAANWAAYRSRDLRRRIDRIVAADHIGAGPRVPGFRFASKRGAVAAADNATHKLRELLAKGDKRALGDELGAMAPYLADQRYAAELFKRLGPKGVLDLVTALRGDAGVLIIGRALEAGQESGVITSRFLERMVEGALKRDAAVNAYVHPWGAVDARDRLKDAMKEWEQSTAGPPGLHGFMEAIAPLIPYVEAGAKVAVIGDAVVIVTAAGACVALSYASCLGPATAFVDESAVVFASEASAVPTGLLETLPVDYDEAQFSGFIERIHARLPQFLGGVIRGSSATGVSFKTGEPFRDASDIDLAIVHDGLWAKVEELGIERWGAGTRTPPLSLSDLGNLGLKELQAELTEIAGHRVSIMIYRSMGDVLARGPGIVLPPA